MLWEPIVEVWGLATTLKIDFVIIFYLHFKKLNRWQQAASPDILKR